MWLVCVTLPILLYLSCVSVWERTSSPSSHETRYPIFVFSFPFLSPLVVLLFRFSQPQQLSSSFFFSSFSRGKRKSSLILPLTTHTQAHTSFSPFPLLFRQVIGRQMETRRERYGRRRKEEGKDEGRRKKAVALKTAIGRGIGEYSYTHVRHISCDILPSRNDRILVKRM